jgi:translation initiation factor IF-3
LKLASELEELGKVEQMPKLEERMTMFLAQPRVNNIPVSAQIPV